MGDFYADAGPFLTARRRVTLNVWLIVSNSKNLGESSLAGNGIVVEDLLVRR